MALTDSEIGAIVRKHLGDASTKRCEVHWDTAVRAAGARVQAGPGDVSVPFEGYFRLRRPQS